MVAKRREGPLSDIARQCCDGEWRLLTPRQTQYCSRQCPSGPSSLSGYRYQVIVIVPTTALIAGIVMTRLVSSAAVMFAVAAVSYAVDVWAADIIPMKAPPAAADYSTPRSCTDAWSFISTNCQLAWQGITVYGTIDMGAGWQSHGAPLDPLSAVSASYLIQKQNNGPLCTLCSERVDQFNHWYQGN